MQISDNGIRSFTYMNTRSTEPDRDVMYVNITSERDIDGTEDIAIRSRRRVEADNVHIGDVRGAHGLRPPGMSVRRVRLIRFGRRRLIFAISLETEVGASSMSIRLKILPAVAPVGV
jgi:hypothetical protein